MYSVNECFSSSLPKDKWEDAFHHGYLVAKFDQEPVRVFKCKMGHWHVGAAQRLTSVCGPHCGTVSMSQGRVITTHCHCGIPCHAKR